jgi:hypothetical protein
MLNKYSKDELLKVCVASKLCKQDKKYTLKQLKEFIRENERKVILRLRKLMIGGTVNLLEMYNSDLNSYIDNFSRYIESYTPEKTPTVKEFGTENYREMTPAEFDKYKILYGAKLTFDHFLSCKQENGLIRLIKRSNNALTADIRNVNMFLKVAGTDEQMDFLETDCIITRLIRDVVSDDRKKYFTEFASSFPLYVTKCNKIQCFSYASQLANLTVSPAYPRKALLLKKFNGSSLAEIMFKPIRHGDPDLNLPALNAGEICYDPEKCDILIKKDGNPPITSTDELNDIDVVDRYNLFDSLETLFRAMIELNESIGFGHNDSHLNNIIFDKDTLDFRLIDYGRSYFNSESSEAMRTINDECLKMSYTYKESKVVDDPKTSENFFKTFSNMYTLTPDAETEVSGIVPLIYNDIASIMLGIMFLSSSKLPESLEKINQTFGVNFFVYSDGLFTDHDANALKSLLLTDDTKLNIKALSWIFLYSNYVNYYKVELEKRFSFLSKGKQAEFVFEKALTYDDKSDGNINVKGIKDNDSDCAFMSQCVINAGYFSTTMIQKFLGDENLKKMEHIKNDTLLSKNSPIMRPLKKLRPGTVQLGGVGTLPETPNKQEVKLSDFQTKSPKKVACLLRLKERLLKQLQEEKQEHEKIKNK